jgi:protein phosphatase methylesterase 1
MGGALAARVCQYAEQNKSFTVQGLCVIDVVEGSAMEALQCMTNVLRARPTAFTTKQKAIEWWCVPCVCFTLV